MIRNAALTVCIGCILVGVLKSLLPQGYCNRVINQLCALYILVSLLTAVQDVPWHELYAMLENGLPQVQALDYTQSMWDLYCGEVQQRAQALVASHGVGAECICRTGADGALYLEIIPEDAGAGEKIETLFVEAWREGIPYIILKKEGGE
ncbi:MAG: hypothetical protein IIV90_00750 [Oscillospiraceae bacterium]|nr:hypothetical protein [Oscillospiraceae bacterium]